MFNWQSIKATMAALFGDRKTERSIAQKDSGLEDRATEHSIAQKDLDLYELLQSSADLPLSSLDNSERQIRSAFGYSFSHAKIDPNTSPELAWLYLSHSNGHVREKAIRRLSIVAPNSLLLTVLIRRVNDWVPQVQAAARQVLPSVFAASKPDDVVDALFAILPHWNSWQRIAPENLQVVLDLMGQSRLIESYKAKLIAAESGGLNRVFAQLGRSPVLDSHLADIAQHAIQSAIRNKAYQSMLSGEVNWVEGRKWQWTDLKYCKGREQPVVASRLLSLQYPLLDTLNAAAADRSVMVRRLAAQSLINSLDLLGQDAFALAERLSRDAAPSVVERGEFVLKKLSANRIRIAKNQFKVGDSIDQSNEMISQLFSKE